MALPTTCPTAEPTATPAAVDAICAIRPGWPDEAGAGAAAEGGGCAGGWAEGAAVRLWDRGDAGLILAGPHARGLRGRQPLEVPLSSFLRMRGHRLRHVVVTPRPCPRAKMAHILQGHAIRSLWVYLYFQSPLPTGSLSRSHLAGRAAMLRLPRGMVAAVALAELSLRRRL